MNIENPFHAPVYYKEKTESTMADALDAAKQGAPRGTTCWTSWQSKGRGRLPGRVWHSSPGESLMLTVLLHEDSLRLKPTLSLRIGLAVARTLEALSIPDISIKWPNDIYSSGKKLCGILCEYRAGFLLAGIGLNLNQKQFPDDLPRAGSLSQLSGISWEPQTVLKQLLPEIYNVLEDSISLDEWNRRLLFHNQEISLLAGDPGKKEEYKGILLGISEEGALILELDRVNKEKKYIYSGELQF